MCSFFQQRQAVAKAQRLDSRSRLAGAQEALRIIRPTVAATTLNVQGWRSRYWSLVPAWAKTPRLKFATFNARAESVRTKPSFREAWQRGQRCLIPAANYSEWLSQNGGKIRHEIGLQNGEDMMLAGLWSDWSHSDETHPSFTVITTPAIESIQWLHARSPLMLPTSAWDRWLYGSAQDCVALLQAQDPGALRVEVAQ